jgi:hypothetical protein
MGAGLMEDRRAEYEVYSLVFWRRQRGILPAHAAFLASQVASSEAIALCCDDGVAIATRDGEQYYVDDFAVVDNQWQDVGGALLIAVWEGAQRRGARALRVVTARLDQPKVAMLSAMGPRVQQQWWVKPLARIAVEGANPGVLESDGYRIVRGAAPPVYDPGGPVGLLQHFEGEDALTAAESAASQDGLVLLIAPLGSSHKHEAILFGHGYEVASQFYVGVPTKSPTAAPSRRARSRVPRQCQGNPCSRRGCSRKIRSSREADGLSGRNRAARSSFQMLECELRPKPRGQHQLAVPPNVDRP